MSQILLDEKATKVSTSTVVGTTLFSAVSSPVNAATGINRCSVENTSNLNSSNLPFRALNTPQQTKTSSGGNPLNNNHNSNTPGNAVPSISLQHLSESSDDKFIQLLNSANSNAGIPAHFYPNSAIVAQNIRRDFSEKRDQEDENSDDVEGKFSPNLPLSQNSHFPNSLAQNTGGVSLLQKPCSLNGFATSDHIHDVSTGRLQHDYDSVAAASLADDGKENESILDFLHKKTSPEGGGLNHHGRQSVIETEDEEMTEGELDEHQELKKELEEFAIKSENNKMGPDDLRGWYYLPSLSNMRVFSTNYATLRQLIS